MEWETLVEGSVETVQRMKVPGGWLYRSLVYDLDEDVTLPAQALCFVPSDSSPRPGGLGVFESVIVLALSGVPAAQLAGSLLAWRAVYYVLPLCVAALMFGGQQILAVRPRLSRLEQLVAVYVTPIVPQVSGALVLVGIDRMSRSITNAVAPSRGRMSVNDAERTSTFAQRAA